MGRSRYVSLRLFWQGSILETDNQGANKRPFAYKKYLATKNALSSSKEGFLCEIFNMRRSMCECKGTLTPTEWLEVGVFLRALKNQVYNR